MNPIIFAQLVGSGIVVSWRLFKRRRQNLAFQEILEKHHQWSAYLASKIDDAGIELDEFDWIVLHNLFGIQKESVD